MKTSLYRYYNSDNRLLYVGISHHPFSRVCQHGYSGKSMTDVAHIELEWFGSREIALSAEALAISREKPIWNISRPKTRQLAKTDMRAEVVPLVVASGLKHPESPIIPNGAGPPAPWVKYALGNVSGEHHHKFSLERWELAIRLLRTGDILTIESGWSRPNEIAEAAVRQWFYVLEDAA